MLTYHGKEALKTELVERAYDHQAHDRLGHVGYGAATWFSDRKIESEFHGCAIGCLATPIKITKAVVTRGPMFEVEEKGHAGSYIVAGVNSARAYRTLETKFGLPGALCAIGETVFETYEGVHAEFDHPEDREDLVWPAQFVEAIPVGIPMDDHQVIDWLIVKAHSHFAHTFRSYDDYVDGEEVLRLRKQMQPFYERSDWHDNRDQVLDWLRSLEPASERVTIPRNETVVDGQHRVPEALKR